MDVMHRRRKAFAMALVTAALVVPGCGGDDDEGGGGDNGGSENTLTADQVSSLEGKIKDRLSDSGAGTSTDLSPTTTIDSVDCPDEIPAEEGAKFDCTATGSAGEQTVKVELLSADGQSYKYESSSP